MNPVNTATGTGNKVAVLRAVTLASYEIGRLSKLLDKNPSCRFITNEEETAFLCNQLNRASTAAGELCDSLRPGGAS